MDPSNPYISELLFDGPDFDLYNVASDVDQDGEPDGGHWLQITVPDGQTLADRIPDDFNLGLPDPDEDLTLWQQISSMEIWQILEALRDPSLDPVLRPQLMLVRGIYQMGELLNLPQETIKTLIAESAANGRAGMLGLFEAMTQVFVEGARSSKFVIPAILAIGGVTLLSLVLGVPLLLGGGAALALGATSQGGTLVAKLLEGVR